MSKNLTRKGLAFGALVALASTVIAGAPANAIGEDGNVTLAPNAGTEYSVLAGSTFDLKANYSNAVSIAGHNLKFLVTDPSAKSKFDLDVNGATADANANNTPSSATVTQSGATGNITATVVVTTTGANTFKIGDSVTVSGLTATDTNTLNAINTTATVTGANGTTFTYVTASFAYVAAPGTIGVTGSPSAIGATAASVDGLVAADAIAARPLGSRNIIGSTASVGARKTDNSYVIDTGTAAFNTSNTVLRLINTDPTASATFTVTAWIDDNGDGLVDSNESKSPVRTVKFVTNADLTTTTTIRPVAVGDTNVSADVTTSPVLNGDQIVAGTNPGYAAALKVRFTRQDSAKAIDVAAGSTVWNDTSKKWTVTSVDMSDSATVNTDSSANAAGWSIAQPAVYPAGLAITSAQIKSDVITVTTGTTLHGLKVGDKVKVSGATTTKTWVNGDSTITAAPSVVTITAVPTTTTFSYAAATTGNTDDATTTVPGGSPVIQANVPATGANHPSGSNAAVAGITGTKILRNYAVAGTYTAQAYFAVYTAVGTLGTAATAGAKASVDANAKVASSVSVGGSGTAVSADAASIKTGTTAATLVATVKDSDGNPVAAGVDVSIAATATSVGTVTLNATTIGSASKTIYAKTDASGQVKIELANSSAVAGESVVFTVTSQGVSSSQITSTWASSVFSILNLNDQTSAGTARNLVAVSGGTATLDLLVQDQYLQPADSATYRLVVKQTGRTVGTNTVALTAGKATVVISDGALTTGTTVVGLTFQKLVSGTWTDYNGTNTTYNDWNNYATDYYGTRSQDTNDLAPVTVTWKSSTAVDKITLNAKGANYPSVVTAITSATVATVALTAVDSRVSSATPSAVVTANKNVISGKVSDSVSGAARAGAVVTFTGAGLLFKSGNVWSIGSASVLTNDGTFDVEVYSSASGDKKVTVAVGAVSTTATITFTGVSTDAKKLTVTPSSTTYVAGQTVVYTILLTDTNGNPVNTVAPAATPASAFITVSYEGPGIISGSLPVETDADGKATVRIVTGTTDTQNAVLTVKYDQNYDGDVLDTNDLTVASTVPVLVVEPSAIVNVIGHRVYVKFANAKGEEVSAVIGGVRITKTATYNGYVVSRWIKKAGKYSVKAYVAGDLVKAATVTVK